MAFHFQDIPSLCCYTVPGSSIQHLDLPDDMCGDGISMENFSYDLDNQAVPCFGYGSITNGPDVPCQVESIRKFSTALKLMNPKLPDTLPGCLKDAVSDIDIKHNPQHLRETLMSKYNDGVRNHKIFSKKAKYHVTSVKATKASAARRKHEARFSCAIEGCYSKFTRRHNLNSEIPCELPNCNL